MLRLVKLAAIVSQSLCYGSCGRRRGTPHSTSLEPLSERGRRSTRGKLQSRWWRAHVPYRRLFGDHVWRQEAGHAAKDVEHWTCHQTAVQSDLTLRQVVQKMWPMLSLTTRATRLTPAAHNHFGHYIPVGALPLGRQGEDCVFAKAKRQLLDRCVKQTRTQIEEHSVYFCVQWCDMTAREGVNTASPNLSRPFSVYCIDCWSSRLGFRSQAEYVCRVVLMALVRWETGGGYFSGVYSFWQEVHLSLVRGVRSSAPCIL